MANRFWLPGSPEPTDAYWVRDAHGLEWSRHLPYPEGYTFGPHQVPSPYACPWGSCLGAPTTEEDAAWRLPLAQAEEAGYPWHTVEGDTTDWASLLSAGTVTEVSPLPSLQHQAQ